MKRTLAPVLIALTFSVMFSSTSIAFGETMDELVKRDGIYYKKFTDVPFTGKITGQEQGSLKDGKKHGPWMRYHDNGKWSDKGTFKDDKMDGLWVGSYKNGQLRYRGFYKVGKQHLLWVGYYKTGQLRYKGFYKDGKRHLLWVFYRENGEEDPSGVTSKKDYVHEGSGTYKDGVRLSD